MAWNKGKNALVQESGVGTHKLPMEEILQAVLDGDAERLRVALDSSSDVSTETTLAALLAELQSKANPAEWTEATTADNLAATVTRGAELGKRHYITGVSGSFSEANVKVLTLKDGAAVIATWHVHNQRDLEFSAPIELSENSAAELSLEASGTIGQVGAVLLRGYTI